MHLKQLVQARTNIKQVVILNTILEKKYFGIILIYLILIIRYL